MSPLLGEGLQVQDQGVRNVLGGRKGRMCSGTKSRVDLGSPVDDVLNDWRGVLEERCQSSIVDSLGLLDDDEILCWGLEGIREGSLGSVEGCKARPSADSSIGLVLFKIG